MEEKSEPPKVYVIAGPNGAGKTTFSSQFLPHFVSCREFLNADLIAAGLAPFAPETQNIKAGRLLLERIGELADVRANFGFETTLAGKTYLKRLSDLKTAGYQVMLFFLWLPNEELAAARVANRVRQGGHRVPADDIRRRYAAGVRNFFHLYRPILDGWRLYDASQSPPMLIASEWRGKMTLIQKRLFDRIIRQAEGAHDEGH